MSYRRNREQRMHRRNSPVWPGEAVSVAATSDPTREIEATFPRVMGSCLQAKYLIYNTYFDWRSRRDSNPRYVFTTYNGLANRRLQPLGHSSVGRLLPENAL